VVYGIVKTADGAIEVESLESAGSVFTIHLPACPDVPPAANPAPHGGDKVILLAEDEEMLGELMQRILRRRGFRVLAARNGAEALKIAEEFDGTIDLLITDVVMPEVTGTELAERLRHTRPATRVLFISGYTDARIIQESVRVDRADFMHKPFTPQVFDDKVRELLVRPT
jgi:DNA-binding response OmpR family regulator